MFTEIIYFFLKFIIIYLYGLHLSQYKQIIGFRKCKIPQQRLCQNRKSVIMSSSQIDGLV